MNHLRVYAGIDLDALEHNVSLIESRLPKGTELFPIIKADAYGHGAVPFARFLENRSCYFGVATIDEAIELRRAGIKTPILILGYIHPEFYETAIRNNITLTVFDFDDALMLEHAAETTDTVAKVHIAVDTGMSRIGFQVTETDADEASRIAGLPHIFVEGLFSHFATADEADKTESVAQAKRFEIFRGMLEKRGLHIPLVHLNNSAGIMEMDGTFYNAARAGIVLYGLYPSEEVAKETFPLKPVMSLMSHISHVKTLPAGRGISYGHTYVTSGMTRVATIPVGYADGYPRALSNTGHVLIKGVRCPILGRICMDQLMVDVTYVPDVKKGDTVTLIGRDGDCVITVEELADPAASFNYEFVCQICRRVPRVYLKNGKPVLTVSYLDFCSGGLI